ncbi:hypothetical protein ACLOJK_025285 [Asimina triloba]
MENASRIPLQDSQMASRRAEEAALRRFQAAEWLATMAGPIGLSSGPSEPEFLSCLRNGLVLCNAINKIQPGAVPKVVESHSSSAPTESQTLPAYQYFENVRNFLVAVKDLKLPAFEASDLERDTLEAGSAAKIVDCILALKSYHEWKQLGSGNGSWKHTRSPLVPNCSGRIQSNAAGASDHCRRLDMSSASEKQQLVEIEICKREDLLAKVLAECLFESKENIDHDLLDAFRSGNQLNLICTSTKARAVFDKCLGLQDSQNMLIKILLSSFHEHATKKHPELQSVLKDDSVEEKCLIPDPVCKPPDNSVVRERNDSVEVVPSATKEKTSAEKTLEVKDLLRRSKEEFKALQSQLQIDLMQLGSLVQELSTAALGFHRVMRENRDLYNTLQDLKGNIRVYCRIRPISGIGSKSTVNYIGDDGSLIILDPLKLQKDSKKLFQFNKCGPLSGSIKDKGINYLALSDLFEISCKRKDIMKYEVRVQMVEIYNEQIRNCAGNGGLNLPDANMHLVQSTEDVLNLMKLGAMNRVVSSTAVNIRSSRSHSILTVHVEGKDTSGIALRSCLHLVDLAGSERVDKSEVTGDRLKEAQHINRSLSCLGDVISALAQKNVHIPYRNSKLTQLLQDSLGGHAKTLMFAHVSPEADSYSETISTLKFAQRVSTVELGAARVNKESKEIRELKDQCHDQDLLEFLNDDKPVVLNIDIGVIKMLQIEFLNKALATKEGEGQINLSTNKTKESRSPIGNLKHKNELTPQLRRLSIESPSLVKSELLMNSQKKKDFKSFTKIGVQTEHSPTRHRRLSLEGPNSAKKLNLHIIKSDYAHTLTDNVESQEAEASSSGVDCCSSVRAMTDASCHLSHNNISSQMQRTQTEILLQPPKSPEPPTSNRKLYQNWIHKESSAISKSQLPIGAIANRTIPLQQPKTPEPPSSSSRKLYQNGIQNEPNSQNKSQVSTRASVNRKGSQIRKSLQTIGKLINGSERRIHQDSLETTFTDVKTPPLTANARSLRRQSLTGGVDISRRSSLGGRSTDACEPKWISDCTNSPILQNDQEMAVKFEHDYLLKHFFFICPNQAMRGENQAMRGGAVGGSIALPEQTRALWLEKLSFQVQEN